MTTIINSQDGSPVDVAANDTVLITETGFVQPDGAFTAGQDAIYDTQAGTNVIVQGTVVGEDGGTPGSLFNTNYYPGGDGAYLSDGGRLTNTATGIIAGGDGTSLHSEYYGGDGAHLVNVAFVNAGIVAGGDSGVPGSGNGGVGVFQSGGTLNNTETGFIVGGNGGAGGDGVYSDNGGTITNAGGIVGGGGSNGADSGNQVGVVLNGGTLSNTGSGYIQGGVGGTFGVAGVGVAIENGAQVVNSGSITGGASPYLYADGGDGVSLTSGSANTLSNTATGVIVGGSGGGAGLSIFGNSGTATNSGTIVGGDGVGSGAVLDAGATLNNTSTGAITGGSGEGQVGGYGVVLDGGTLITSGAISGGAGAALGDAVQFAASSEMVVKSGAQFNGAIGGFAYGDTVDITNLAPSVAAADFNNSTDVLNTPTDGQLHFAGTTGDTFLFTSDGAGGTDVSVACYCIGTRIQGEFGEAPIECLKIGDRVKTMTGALLPIRWIGKRRYGMTSTAGRSDLSPIRIGAGALGDDLPKRDLWVSPEHAMYIDGMLIPAMALVNGASIIQEGLWDEVEYIHLEFDVHTVIFAEGAPAESFVDDASRRMFDNAREYSSLYPSAVRRPAQFCGPRVDEGWELEAVRLRLAERALKLLPLSPGRLARAGEGNRSQPVGCQL